MSPEPLLKLSTDSSITQQAYGVWNSAWTSRIRCVTGNLGDPQLGIAKDVWEDLTQSVDIVIHNGAHVHWVYVENLFEYHFFLTTIRYPYSKLQAPNVQGTIDAMELCATGKPKRFIFVSSTAVLDNEHYVKLSDRLCSERKAGVPENDDLEGSRTGLGQFAPY